MEIKECIIAFAWEPVGHKFAIIQGESPRITVSFYKVQTGGGAIELLGKDKLGYDILNKQPWGT